MKAVIQTRYGTVDDLRVEETAAPSPESDEVLVKVKAAAVHPDVWHVVCGRPRVLRLMGAGFKRPKNPIPGTDMSGIVETVGDKVSVFKPGDAVFGETIADMQWVNGGAFAEYATVKATNLARKPENVSFEQAASLPTAGFIVLLNLDMGKLVTEGTEVLINGAGGGVGSLALQLIKHWGGRVTAVDCDNKLDMLKKLGADEAVDYKTTNYTEMGVQFDIIFDIPGNYRFAELKKALKPNGKYIPIGHDDFGKKGNPILGTLPYFISLSFRSMINKQLPKATLKMPPKSEVMEILRRALTDGSLTPLVAKTFPLEAVSEAMHYMMEENPMGKVILTP